MDEFDPKQFHSGLLLGNRPEDFLSGVNSPIPFEARNTTADWDRFKSVPEDQFNSKGDWFNCTNESGENQFETQANWALINNLWPKEALEFFNGKNSLNLPYIIDGRFNISTRFNTKLSGTVPGKGNWMYKAQDSIRKDGVVPEAAWPTLPDMSVADYYNDPFPAVVALGKESLKFYDWLYEFLNDLSIKNIEKQLQHAPIQLGIATCPGWSTGVVPVCSMESNHTVLLQSREYLNPRYLNILDHYSPYLKKLAPGYLISSAVKGVLYPKSTTATQLNTDIVSPLTKDIAFGDSGDEVAHLKLALKKAGWLPDYKYNPDEIEVYDTSLTKVVFNFQLANISHLWLEMLFSLLGKRVGEKTRATLNEIIKYRN